MPEIWLSGEKVGTWNGASTPVKGDELPVVLDGQTYHAEVKRVFSRHSEHAAPTTIIEIEEPRPPQFFYA